ncbi:Spo11/DNA topoisomerase VI subunit A [Pelagophyceae sp. CCMP2097]|nr:Spo11/DNA topoisomerase VI subunit A [Pelagophyceae sp. CCMP2097]
MKPEVLEAWLLDLLDSVAEEGRFPAISIAARGEACEDALDGDDEPDGPARRAPKRKQMTPEGARSYAGLICAASFCHRLLSEGKTATQRELYYMHKGGAFSPWSTQAECNESIKDVSQCFSTDRAALGITTSARGCIAGCVRLRRPGGEWLDLLREGVQAIDHDWITVRREIESDARCVVVVEKDGIFRRLVDDGYFARRKCILVTGCGVPDVATRACVAQLRAALRVPVYGLVDWNPYGAGILAVFKRGSRFGVTAEQQYAVDVRWLGLRSSQVEAAQLPDSCMQPLNVHDERRARGLLADTDIPETWRGEVERQLEVGAKCELEALCTTGGGFSNVADFVESAISRGDYL